MAQDTLNLTVSLNVEGKEGLDLTLKYSNTTIDTVLLVEGALIQTLANLIKAQQDGKI